MIRWTSITSVASPSAPRARLSGSRFTQKQRGGGRSTIVQQFLRIALCQLPDPDILTATSENSTAAKNPFNTTSSSTPISRSKIILLHYPHWGL
jgi:hypothetical protein